MIRYIASIYLILSFPAFGQPPPVPDTNAPPTGLVVMDARVGAPYKITGISTNAPVTNLVEALPFLIASGVDTNGRPILARPPQWMLDGEPDYLPTMRVTFYNELTTGAVWSAEFKGTTNDTSFAKWEIVTGDSSD